MHLTILIIKQCNTLCNVVNCVVNLQNCTWSLTFYREVSDETNPIFKTYLFLIFRKQFLIEKIEEIHESLVGIMNL